MKAASDLKKADRIGVFGGTFDPVHYGHLICAEQVREAVGLDIVLFMPCSRQPHKPRYIPSDAADRLDMLRAAVRGNPAFRVSDIETRRGGVSFTADTVARLRHLVGEGPAIWLLLGMDAFLEIPRWKDPDFILKECRFAVAARPGYTRPAVPGRLARKTRFVKITAVDISSTDVRRRVARGRSIRYLVPGPVETLIRNRHLYL
jgi:nicotinate-nucleotide adenylyltransferase